MGFKFKANARAVNPNGTFTTEALSALQGNTGKQLVFTAQSFMANERCEVFLPAAMAVNRSRDGQTVTVTTNNLMLNKGDSITLSAPQTITLVPI